MAANTAQEQLMLELINRARMDPVGEAARQGISLNQGLAAGTISTAPKQVLAMNDQLVVAADNHSKWMLQYDIFSHQESGSHPTFFTGVNPNNRMATAGYIFAGPAYAYGENISWTGIFPGPINLTSAIIAQHRSLFLSPGHRTNILNATFEEVGIGQEHGAFLSGGTNYDASMITQDFALSGSKVFVTGVVYNDTVVNDNFFSVGEQVVGRGIAGPGGASDVTGGGGGYELAFTAGGYKAITFDLATGPVGVLVVVGTTNVKVDVVNGREVWTNANLNVTTGNVTDIRALGIQALILSGSTGNEAIVGNAAANTLIGGGGNDYLSGGGGNDRVVGDAGNDKLICGPGVDTLTGGANADIFVFNTAPGTSANRDIITDFSHVDDTFQLENALFTKLGALAGVHMLTPAYFRAGAAALDANDYIVYNHANGALYYDSNGNAAGGAIQIAALSNRPVLAADDFVVI